MGLRSFGAVRGALIGGVVTGFLALAPGALAFGTFSSVNTIATGGAVYGVGIGDLNRDGKADIVATNDSGTSGSPSGDVSVLYGKGNGTFKPEVKVKDPRSPEDVAIGKFNGDKRPDLAVVDYNYGPPSYVSIFLGKKGGGFSFKRKITVKGGPWLIRAADLNRDGKTDLVTGGYDVANDAVSVLLGKGDGSFKKPKSYPSSAGLYGIAVGRMNADKRPDVVTGDGADDICVLLTAKDGTLGAPRCRTTSGGQSYHNVAVADFTGDGKMDVAVADYNGDHVFVVPGNGKGRLGAPLTPQFVGNYPDSIVAARLDDGSTMDVATANYVAAYGAEAFFGNGDGTFGGNVDYDGSDTGYAIAAGRLNADAGNDLVVGTASGVDVFLNQP